MVRTQIQISEEQAAALKAKAVIEGVSMAELVRKGVDLVLESLEHGSKPERIRRAIEAAGRFRADVSDLSINHDKYVAEAFEK